MLFYSLCHLLDHHHPQLLILPLRSTLIHMVQKHHNFNSPKVSRFLSGKLEIFSLRTRKTVFDVLEHVTLEGTDAHLLGEGVDIEGTADPVEPVVSFADHGIRTGVTEFEEDEDRIMGKARKVETGIRDVARRWEVLAVEVFGED